MLLAPDDSISFGLVSRSRASVSQVCNPTATLLAILQVHSELIFGSVSLNERPTLNFFTHVR